MTATRILSLATLALAIACAPAEENAELTVAESGGDVLPAAVVQAPKAALHLTVAGGRNEARYLVRERLMGKDLDNDAVGVTGEVTGGFAVDSAGAVIPGASRFVVRIGGLTSDNGRRDGYVQRRLLEAEQHPEVTFVPTAVRGLSAAAARGASGPQTFQLLGDLTVKGVTKPVTWQVTAQRAGANVTGTARTGFTFSQFGLTQPRVPVVLSVADTIRLEYDFTLAPAAGGR